MAHLHKKIKKGRPYYYIREIARINGKTTVVSQVYLGSLERMLEMASGNKEECVKIKSQEFGTLWLANLIDQDIDLVNLVDGVVPPGKGETGPTIGEYFLYAVFNRMVDSCSKRSLPGWFSDSAIQQIRPVNVDKLTSQRYWDKWDRVKESDVASNNSGDTILISHELNMVSPELLLALAKMPDIPALTATRAQLKDLLTKMTAMKAGVPDALATAEAGYLAEIDARKGYLEIAFQKSLNVGFKHVYLTVVIASVLALLLMAFYRKNRSADKNEK
jgi:hypothetical protein